MFRKVPFIWSSHFPKLLFHWLEKSHFLTPSGSVHLLSVPSPADNQLAPHHESLVPILGPWICFIYNTQARNLQYSIKKLVPLQGPQVCQIIKTTNNIFPLFDDDKHWSHDLRSSPTLFTLFIFPLTVCSPSLKYHLATHNFTSPFWHHKKETQ